MRRRILVTGGTGFAGGRICASFAGSKECEILVGSRSVTPPRDWCGPGSMVALNWSSADSLAESCAGVDVIVHLAALNDRECAADPVAALEVNAVNTARLVQAARQCSVGEFIYFSTIHVYGGTLTGAIDEGVCPRSVHPYATSHRAAEDVVLAAAPGLSTVVFRLSNAFGCPARPGVNAWHLLVNDLCRQAVMERSMTLRSSGLQHRDFITMHDVVRLVRHAVDPTSGRSMEGIYNVGSGVSTRVIDMAYLVRDRCAAVLGYVPKIIRPQPLPSEQALTLDYNIRRLLDTGFTLTGEPSGEIDETLALCKNHFAVH
jgi:UDP-glucose 4-epimerase